MSETITIRMLDTADAAAFQAFRLCALLDRPEAFGSSYDEEKDEPLGEVAQRLGARPNAVFGAFAEGQLVGIAGFARNPRLKQKHKGLLWGVHVDRQWRGQGLGRKLTLAVIEHARQHVDTLHATVMAENVTARNLYLALGFAIFGVEKDALREGGRSYTDELLRLDFQ